MTGHPYLDDGDVRLYVGDCIEVMAGMASESIDAVVCDPPYGLEFMGKAWDSFRVDDSGTSRFRGERAAAGGGGGVRDAVSEHPGNRARVSYGGGKRPTTSRCTGCGKRDAFRNEHECQPGAAWRTEVVDAFAAPPASLAFEEWCRTWAIEALRVLKPGGHLIAFGATRLFHRLTCGLEDAGFEVRDCLSWLYGSGFPKSLDVSKAIDKAAGHWRGRAGGQVSSNPAMPSANYERTDKGEPITAEAERWQGWGTALKPAWEPAVLCRKPLAGTVAETVTEHGTGALNIDGCRIVGAKPATTRGAGGQRGRYSPIGAQGRIEDDGKGRWPANVALDPDAAAMLDAQTGPRGGSAPASGPTHEGPSGRGAMAGGFGGMAGRTPAFHGGVEGASRFFYTSKASTAERDGATHPTVKPRDLMRWLVRMVTPPGGVVLDPFSGSGTTLLAARDEGFRAIGIEQSEEYAAMIAHRLRQLSLLGGLS